MLQYGLGIGSASAAPAAFDPTAYGTMLAGYDTFDVSRVLNPSGVAVSNNDLIDQLTDRSGNARHARQTTNTKRPIYKSNVLNGYGVIDMDGVAQFLEMPSCMTITQNKAGFAAALVHEQADTAANYGLFEFEDAAYNHRLRLFTTPQWSVEGHRLDADANAQLFSSGHDAAAGTWYISILVWDPVAGTLGVWANSNSSSVIKNDGTGATPFGTSGGNTDNTASGENPVLGAANLYNSQLWKGQLAAAYFYDLASFNRSGLMSALGTLLGITIS